MERGGFGRPFFFLVLEIRQDGEEVFGKLFGLGRANAVDVEETVPVGRLFVRHVDECLVREDNVGRDVALLCDVGPAAL